MTKAYGSLNQQTVIDESVLDGFLKEVSNALMNADVNLKLVMQVRTNVKKNVNLEELAVGLDKKKIIQKALHDELVRLLDPQNKPFIPKKGKANVIMFVGLQGSGKTTTCAKFGHYYEKKGWKTALVCADTFRAGAFDQLKQNATKAKIPFYGSYTEANPVIVAKEGVDKFRNEGYEIIIVDTSGRHKQENELFTEMKQVSLAVNPDEHIFVVDSSIGQAAFDQAAAFRNSVNVGSVIVTKMDGHAKGGGALSAVAATKSPIVFIGTGEHLDEFQPFNAESFISRLLGMGDVKGLVSKIKETGLDQDPSKFANIKKGVFTYRDLHQQFSGILKMGPLGDFMSMIPGMGPDLMSKGKEKESVERIKTFIHIMDSMTNKEMDDQTGKLMNESRAWRIARGSGKPIQLVMELIQEHKRIGKIVSKMKTMMPKGARKSDINMDVDAMSNQLIQKLLNNRG